MRAAGPGSGFFRDSSNPAAVAHLFQQPAGVGSVLRLAEQPALDAGAAEFLQVFQLRVILDCLSPLAIATMALTMLVALSLTLIELMKDLSIFSVLMGNCCR